MKNQKRLLALLLILVIAVLSLAACTPARKPNPTTPYGNNAPNNNYTTNYPGQGNVMPYTAKGTEPRVGTNTNTNPAHQTSSLFSKLDYSFATITDNINIRSGPHATTPTAGALKKGDAVKVIGKLNGWYVVNVPNTNKIGCVSPNYANLYSAQPGTTTPSPTKPVPATQTTPAAPTTPSGAAPGANAPSTATGSGTLSSQGSRILQLANAERAKVGAKPLTSNTELNKLANMKSQDIVEKNYFSHQSPTYGSPFDMMKTYGVQYMYAGENLAINSDADKAHTAWMNSEGHRRNILNPDFTEIGIGLYPKGDGSYAYTQMFIGK